MIPAAPVVAVLNASVRLSAEGLFQPKWTERIHDEWMRNLLRKRPDLMRERVERTRTLMDRHGGDWQVPPYKHLVLTLSLPDPDDRHVLAAAIASGAAFIVTTNLRHFPAAALVPEGIVALHSDDFVCAARRRARSVSRVFAPALGVAEEPAAHGPGTHRGAASCGPRQPGGPAGAARRSPLKRQKQP
jgi:hypothetical protein